MADPDFLREGDCYFYMSYSDNDLFIPIIETYIYIKSGVDDSNKNFWLFLDADSHRSQNEESEYLGITEDNLSSMLTVSELGKKLQALEHLHPLSGVVAPSTIALTESHRKLIKQQLVQLAQTDGTDSITIVTNFRDKGVSISGDNTSVELSVFIDFREDPGEEEIIRSIFAKHGVTPVHDYLSQHERRRILTYNFEASVAESIICSIFLEAYGIYEHEKLKAAPKL